MTQDLLEMYRQGETLRIVNLKNSLPDAARVLITGVTHTREAWIIFNRRYGGKEITIMTAMHRLIQLNIPLGSKYDKVEALAAEVCTAKRCLNAVETEAEGGLDSGS